MALLQNCLCTFYRRIVRSLFALTAAWLFVSCLVTTNYVSFLSSDAQEVSWLCPDSTWLQCLLFSAVCLLLVRRARRDLRFPGISLRQAGSVRLALIFMAGLLAIFWIVCVQPVPNMDARSVQQTAEGLSSGQPDSVRPGSYLYIYPHQSGLVLLHILLQRINPDTTLPFQLFNILCYMGILYFLGELALELGLGTSGCLAATCAGIAFLPLLFYVSFIYGTISGLCFSMAALVFSIRFSRDFKWYQALLAALSLFLAVALKSNYQIFAIGLLLYVLYRSLQDRNHYWVLLPILCLSLILALKLPLLVIEQRAGCSLRHGNSSISWVAMGLRDESAQRPGWYDGYTDMTYYREANMDPQIQRGLAVNEIEKRLREFSADPAYMLSFFARKNATQWSEPLFQSLWLNLTMGESLPRWTASFLRAQGPTGFNWIMNLLQTLVCGGLVLWAWVPTNKKRSPTEDLLAVILLGGFVFHTFWEAKSQYTLPYAALILPLAILGYRRLAELPKDPGAKALWQPISGKLRFLMPILLMALALVLSVVLAPPLKATLDAFLQALSS